ncbi:glycosyltransferase family 39 protein [Legionella sp. km772]|uniref:glycosyltransferase family 39 protein n=1 Tax=Legionella sp. km772 TaxID=2498111 RepID=UPI000F8E291D|nr:glycosyltransferase family 39 protein [Legionella sp. km772]RUR13753.1 glycosyltransferase family 39 protein [Legionella sp. km772]
MTQLRFCSNPLARVAYTTEQKTTVYFILFILLHTLFWTLGSYFSRPSLPHDTLESITWGLQWQWGYPKHPYLTAWLCAAVFSLFNQADWSIYLLAQLVNTSTFVAVWYLAKQFLPSRHALIAVLLLEGVLFYNVNSFNLTCDSLQAPLWACCTLFFYYALTTEKLRHWLLTAFFAACCICTKYQSLILFACMLFLCLEHPNLRQNFKKKELYYAFTFFLLLVSPHLVWLYQHQFISLVYVKTIAYDYTETKTVWGHLLYPILTLLNDLFYIAGVFILSWPFYKKNKARFNISPFQWHFLLIMGLGPVFITTLLGIIDGNYFPPRWATPYFFLLGIIVIGYLKPLLNPAQLKKFSIGFVLFSSLLFGVRMVTLTLFPKPNNDAFLPNRAMALSLSQLWQDRYHRPLAYVVGSNYLVSLITPYLPTKTKPYLNWRLKQNPWVDELELSKTGALFIWDVGFNYAWDLEGTTTFQLPQWLFYRYPELIVLPNATFYRLSNKAPIVIGIAILPPREV